MSDLVQRFLAMYPPYVPSAEQCKTWNIAPHDPERAVANWQAAAAKHGFSCPAELLALAREPSPVELGNWGMYAPPDPTATDGEIEQLAKAPCCAPLSRMLRIFGADGDLLMLASDGAIRRCSAASGALQYDHGIVAPTFAALLEIFVARQAVPGFPDWYGARGAPWQWHDGIEYRYSVGHDDEERDGTLCCVTLVAIDLAPHYRRWPDGPNGPAMDGHVLRACSPCYVEFRNDPMIIPRMQPLGILDLGDQRIDLHAEAPRLISAALERGWTGRDGRKLAFDGWALFGLTAPTQVVTL